MGELVFEASGWNKRAAAAQRLLFAFSVCMTIRPNRIRIEYSVQPRKLCRYLKIFLHDPHLVYSYCFSKSICQPRNEVRRLHAAVSERFLVASDSPHSSELVRHDELYTPLFRTV